MTFNEILDKVNAGHHLDMGDLVELRRQVRDCPAAVVAPAIMLRYAAADLDCDEREELRRRVALYGGFTDAVMMMIDPSGKAFADFYPPEPVSETHLGAHETVGNRGCRLVG